MCAPQRCFGQWIDDGDDDDNDEHDADDWVLSMCLNVVWFYQLVRVDFGNMPNLSNTCY